MGNQMRARERVEITASDGEPLSFVRSGEGPPIMLVHGGAADGRSLVLIAKPLAERYTVLLVDRRGRARPIDPDTYRIEQEYDDLCRFAEAADAPVHVFTHSYGGLCAVGAIARRPELFRAATVYEPPISVPAYQYARDDVAARIRAFARDGAAEEAALTFIREVVELAPHELDAWRSVPEMWEPVVARTSILLCELNGLRGFRLDDEALRRATLPVTTLLGTDSPPKYAASLDRLESVLSSVERVAINGHGHMATAGAPDQIVAAIESTEQKTR